MVSGVSEWPAKAPSPALGLCVPIAPAVSEIACVRCQCLRLQCGSVRIVESACHAATG
jgi:hypothetical protein